MVIVRRSLLPVLLAREIALSVSPRRPFPRAMALLLLRVKSAPATLLRATATLANKRAPLAMANGLRKPVARVMANFVVKPTGLAMVSAPAMPIVRVTAKPAAKPIVPEMARSPAMPHVPMLHLAMSLAAMAQSPKAGPATAHRIPSVANSPAEIAPLATPRVPTANAAVRIPKANIA